VKRRELIARPPLKYSYKLTSFHCLCQRPHTASSETMRVRAQLFDHIGDPKWGDESAFHNWRRYVPAPPRGTHRRVRRLRRTSSREESRVMMNRRDFFRRAHSSPLVSRTLLDLGDANL
jgi:hypothetical protein